MVIDISKLISCYMKNRIILYFVISTFILGSATCQNSYIKDKLAQEEIIKILKSFYTHLATIQNLNKIDSIKRVTCTKNYFMEIENHDELDYEPLIKAQDFGFDCLKTLAIKKDLIRDNLYYVSYIESATKLKVIIKLIIIKKNEQYRIDYVYLDSI
jgi:hypothetical protein